MRTRVEGFPERDGRNDGGDGQTSNSGSSNSSVSYGDLMRRLTNLSFSSFQTLVLLWLSAKGYRDICVLRRAGARGRRRTGGADFIVTSPHMPDVRVAVQIRYWNTPVQPRVVDELWGFMLRQGIPCGLMITNAGFYQRTIDAAREFPGRPIRLVSLAQLAGSLTNLGLSVERSGGQLRISGKFFRALQNLRLASALVTRGPARTGPSLAPRRIDPGSLCGAQLVSHAVKRAVLAIAAILVVLVVLWLTGGSR